MLIMIPWLVGGFVCYCIYFLTLTIKYFIMCGKKEDETLDKLPWNSLLAGLILAYAAATFGLFTLTPEYQGVKEFCKDHITSVKLGKVSLELKDTLEESGKELEHLHGKIDQLREEYPGIYNKYFADHEDDKQEIFSHLKDARRTFRDAIQQMPQDVRQMLDVRHLDSTDR